MAIPGFFVFVTAVAGNADELFQQPGRLAGQCVVEGGSCCHDAVLFLTGKVMFCRPNAPYDFLKNRIP